MATGRKKHLSKLVLDKDSQRLRPGLHWTRICIGQGFAVSTLLYYGFVAEGGRNALHGPQHNVLSAGRDNLAVLVYKGNKIAATADFLMLDLEDPAPRAWTAM